MNQGCSNQFELIKGQDDRDQEKLASAFHETLAGDKMECNQLVNTIIDP